MSNRRNLDTYAETFFPDDLDEDELDSDICPYCGEPMIDDMEVGQGYHVTAPCWMMGTGDHDSLKEWLATQDQ